MERTNTGKRNAINIVLKLSNYLNIKDQLIIPLILIFLACR